jgi:hypothetical protein
MFVNKDIPTLSCRMDVGLSFTEYLLDCKGVCVFSVDYDNTGIQHIMKDGNDTGYYMDNTSLILYKKQTVD